jgi:hypothetical protein
MRTARTAEMTLEEACRISRQSDRGALDLDLPGTSALINEARRIEVHAHIWGTARHDAHRKHLRRAVAVGCGCVVLAISGFALSFLSVAAH